LFTEAEAVPFDAVTAETPLLTPLQAMRGRRVVTLTAAAAVGCQSGRLLRRSDLSIGADEPGPWVAVDPVGGFVGLLEPFRGDLLKPAAVVPRPAPVA
jgi:hypothetical protein